MMNAECGGVNDESDAAFHSSSALPHSSFSF
jgi:hypothetical protein